MLLKKGAAFFEHGERPAIGLLERTIAHFEIASHLSEP
jgi:hypothetical protein